MNYGELKSTIAAWAHRSDLTPLMFQFTDNVTQRLGERFGELPTVLINDSDTNVYLDQHSRIYIVGCQVEVSIHTQDAPAAQVYEQIFQEQLANFRINYTGADLATEPPVITPYVEPV